MLALVAGLARKSNEELNQPKYARETALAMQFANYELGLVGSGPFCESPPSEITNSHTASRDVAAQTEQLTVVSPLVTYNQYNRDVEVK